MNNSMRVLYMELFAAQLGFPSAWDQAVLSTLFIVATAGGSALELPLLLLFGAFAVKLLGKEEFYTASVKLALTISI